MSAANVNVKRPDPPPPGKAPSVLSPAAARHVLTFMFGLTALGYTLSLCELCFSRPEQHRAFDPHLLWLTMAVCLVGLAASRRAD
jgi:hypothetical protein